MANYLSRERTPTSPSPSPEPVGGESAGSASTSARGGATGADGVSQQTTLLGDSSSYASTGAPTSTQYDQHGRILVGTGPDGSGTIGAAAAAGSGGGVPVQQDEMARMVLEEKLRIGVDDLMQLAVCAGDVQPGDEEIVQMKINETMDSLQAIQDACNAPELTQMVPEDVMGMIDQGRNPDIHTRTFTNRLNGDNQQMRGQAVNLDHYRSRLRAKMEAAFPEMKEDLEAVDSY